MLLRRLQERIADTYDLEIDEDVREFVVTDATLLPSGARPGAGGEQLLVESGAGDTSCGIALYLDPQVLDRLERSDPTSALHAGNVADYLTVLEGVSHFVCVAWHAQYDRDVSVLALELQAEIDKYVATFALLSEQCPGRFPAELHDLLFVRCRVAPALAAEREALYRHASEHAARYCRALERKLRRDARGGDAWSRELRSELKRWYRLPEMRKFERAAAAV
jgi:hypothetical protein